LGALATLAALALGNLVPLQAMTRNPAGERVPYRVEVHDLDERWVADVGTRSRHAANGQGLRGDAIVGRDREIIVLGGSTTECSLLDEHDTLARRLRDALESAHAAEPVRVAALAQPGLPLAGLLEEIDAFTRGRRRPDVFVGLFGANETQTFYNNTPWVGTVGKSSWEAWIDPVSPLGVHGREATFRGWYRPGNRGRFLEAPRIAYADERAWQSTLHQAHVSELRAALAGYVASLAELRRIVGTRGASLVLVTQPVAPWASPEGGRGWAMLFFAEYGRGFVPSPALTRQLVEAFNATTRAFAAEHSVPIVDLALLLQGCATCFYDQWHFTREGAARAAAAIAPATAAVGDVP
jgi:hypothetical protein